MENIDFGVVILSIAALAVIFIDPREEQRRQATKYGSWGRTNGINFSMLGLMLSWLYTSTFSNELFMGIFGYLCMGNIIIRFFSVPTLDEIEHLDFSDRLWLRTFYAWWWPYYLFVKSPT